MARSGMREFRLSLARTHEEFAALAASWMLREIRESILEGERCTIALSGGETPRAIHAAVLESPEASRIAWRDVEFYFADERCVPPDHEESNYAMVRETLLASLPVEPTRVHRIQGERSDRDRAAEEYGVILPPALDLLILGIGKDTHTASLFPGSPAILETRRRVVSVPSPVGIPWRITITPPVIAAAQTILVFVEGREKAGAVRQALSEPVDPLQHPIQLADGAHWVLDSGAASALSQRFLEESQQRSRP